MNGHEVGVHFLDECVCGLSSLFELFFMLLNSLDNESVSMVKVHCLMVCKYG